DSKQCTYRWNASNRVPSPPTDMTKSGVSRLYSRENSVKYCLIVALSRFDFSSPLDITVNFTNATLPSFAFCCFCIIYDEKYVVLPELHFLFLPFLHPIWKPPRHPVLIYFLCQRGFCLYIYNRSEEHTSE